MARNSALTRRCFLSTSTSAMLLAAPARVGAPAEYPLFVAQGSHRELGRQHGEQAAEKIKAHLDMMARSAACREKPCAAGAGIPASFRKILSAPARRNSRSCGRREDHVGRGDGGQHSRRVEPRARGRMHDVRDRPGRHLQSPDAGRPEQRHGSPAIPPLGYVLHLKPVNKPEVLTWTFGGMIGYHGMNSAGVAHFANALGGGPGPHGNAALSAEAADARMRSRGSDHALIRNRSRGLERQLRALRRPRRHSRHRGDHRRAGVLERLRSGLPGAYESLSSARDMRARKISPGAGRIRSRVWTG